MSEFINKISDCHNYCCNCHTKFIYKKDKFYIAKDNNLDFAWCKKCFKNFITKLNGFIKL